MKVVVVIPTYNERENIEPIISEVFAQKANTPDDLHILVVDDNSPDGTAEIVKKLMGQYSNLHLLTGQKQGLGAAYIRGFRYAEHDLQADVVVEMDADGQHPPSALPALLKPLHENADVTVGTRYIKGGSVPEGWGFIRKFLSGFGNYVARAVLLLPKYHDMTTGFRATKTSYMRRVDLDSLYSKRFAYKIHLFFLLHKLGARIIEVPLQFIERDKGSSKMITNDIIESLRVVALIRLHESAQVIKFLVVGTIGFFINAFILKLLYDTGFGSFLPQAMVPGSLGPLHLKDVRLFWSTVISAETAIICLFILHENWTFKGRDRKGHIVKRLSKFNLSAIVSPIISVIVINTLTPYFGVPKIVSLGIGTSIGLIYNYIANILWIWRDHKPETE